VKSGTTGDREHRRSLWSRAHQRPIPAEALTDYQAALAADPTCLLAVDYAHVLWRHLDRSEEAAEILEPAVAGSQAAYAHRELGELMARRGEVFVAEQHLRLAIARGPVAQAGDLLARLLADQPGADLDEVEALFRRAIAAGSKPAVRNLARFLLHQPGREDEAVELLETAIEAGSAVACNTLGLLRRRQKDLSAAAVLLQQAVDMGYPPALTNLALVRVDQGDLEDAERLLREAAGFSTAQPWLSLGQLFGRQRRWEEAELAYRAGFDAGMRRVASGLAQALRFQPGREAEAALWAERAIAEGDPQIHMDLGREAQARHDFTSAERELRLAVRAGHPLGNRALALLLDWQGDRPADARQASLDALHDGDQYGHITLGRVCLKEDNVEQAEAHARAALAADLPAAAPLLADALIQQPATLNRNISELQELTQRGDLSARHTLAHVTHALGDTDRAKELHDHSSMTCDRPIRS
jgi:tetratricopeptide (TPR) repeat protein